MPRARRPRARGKPRNITNNSPAVSTNAASSTPPPSRRSAPAAAANASKASGRTTQNSRGNRGRSRGPGGSASRKNIGRNGSSRGRGRLPKRDSGVQDPSFYKDEDGEVYKRGDYAYVDSQQAELPHHICVIRDFKMARKDAVIAEIKWFYRVSELPEAVYLLLMEDRKKENDDIFTHPKSKERELFMAFNVDTHPASLLRGKCKVKEFCTVKDSLAGYLEKDHTFFYNYGYKPESRRLTQLNEESFVPHSQQAVLPECLCPPTLGPTQKPPPELAREYYNRPEEKVTGFEELVWQPKLSDEDLLMYLRAARSIALHAGVCMTGYMADGYLAASSDETTQHAFDVLHCNRHNVEKALLDLVKRPIVSRLIGKKKWSKENAVLFGKGMRQFGKNFTKIQEELLPGKKIVELVEYYYYWKKTNAGLSSRSTRRQRKMTHVRLCRSLLKPREDTPEKEFMDWDSCDEDEDRDFKSKNYYACRHCFSQQSTGWHHAGPAKAILCQSCRQYFLHYGVLGPLPSEKADPPEFMYKDYHESVTQDDNSSTSGAGLQSPPTTGRKTRNSNGSRGGTSSRPGLRSGKNTDIEEEEVEGSGESANDSSCEEEMIPIKHKPLQVRHSLLDKLEEASSKGTLPDQPVKRKREENMTAMSDEYASGGESVSGEQEMDSSQKSPDPREKSPGESSSSSTHADDEGDSPISSGGGGGGMGSADTPRTERAERVTSLTPQQFKRVSKDTESTCARTDLVYVHPPAAEKELAASTTKVPLPGHGSSAHGGGGGIGGHLLEQNLPNTKVPRITPHDPRLPMGPPAMMGFPMVYPPVTPQAQHVPLGLVPAPVVNAKGIIKRSDSTEAAASGHEEQLQQQQMALWRQQQQQQLAALQLAQVPVAHPVGVQTPSFVAIHPPPPHSSHAPPIPETPSQHKPPPLPQAFTFSNEEIGRRWLEQVALQQGGMVPPLGIHQGHPQVLELLFAQQQQQQQQQTQQATPSSNVAARQLTVEEMLQAGYGAARVVLPQEVVAAGYPPDAVNMEHFVAQQQQQQQQQLAVLASKTELEQQLMEFEPIVQQIQKEPGLMHNLRVQMMMQHREQLIQQLQMHDMLLQQEMQKKQQQFVLGRPPTGHEDPTARNRPGVIVNQTK